MGFSEQIVFDKKANEYVIQRTSGKKPNQKIEFLPLEIWGFVKEVKKVALIHNIPEGTRAKPFFEKVTVTYKIKPEFQNWFFKVEDRIIIVNPETKYRRVYAIVWVRNVAGRQTFQVHTSLAEKQKPEALGIPHIVYDMKVSEYATRLTAKKARELLNTDRACLGVFADEQLLRRLE